MADDDLYHAGSGTDGQRPRDSLKPRLAFQDWSVLQQVDGWRSNVGICAPTVVNLCARFPDHLQNSAVVNARFVYLPNSECCRFRRSGIIQVGQKAAGGGSLRLNPVVSGSQIVSLCANKSSSHIVIN